MTVRVHRLPHWAPMDGLTLGRDVFLRDPGDQGLLAHELVHVRQQAEHPVWFWVSYLLLPSWRVRWEIEAYRVDVAGGRLSAEEAARVLSGSLYLWPCSYAAALAALRGSP